jgi:hypothetical protein
MKNRNNISARDAAKINMVTSVADHLQQTEEVHGSHVGFSKGTAALYGVSAELLAAAQMKEVKSGASAAKRELKKQVCVTAVSVAGALVAYGTEVGDFALAHQMEYPKSRVGRGREIAVVGRCREIHGAAVAKLEVLGDYKVTAPKLAAFKKQIDAYESPVLLAKADTILKKRLDKVAVQFEDEHPEFVAKYRSARSIVDPASKAKKKDAAAKDGNVTPDKKAA